MLKLLLEELDMDEVLVLLDTEGLSLGQSRKILHATGVVEFELFALLLSLFC